VGQKALASMERSSRTSRKAEELQSYCRQGRNVLNQVYFCVRGETYFVIRSYLPFCTSKARTPLKDNSSAMRVHHKLVLYIVTIGCLLFTNSAGIIYTKTEDSDILEPGILHADKNDQNFRLQSMQMLQSLSDVHNGLKTLDIRSQIFKRRLVFHADGDEDEDDGSLQDELEYNAKKLAAQQQAAAAAARDRDKSNGYPHDGNDGIVPAKFSVDGSGAGAGTGTGGKIASHESGTSSSWSSIYKSAIAASNGLANLVILCVLLCCTLTLFLTICFDDPCGCEDACIALTMDRDSLLEVVTEDEGERIGLLQSERSKEERLGDGNGCSRRGRGGGVGTSAEPSYGYRDSRLFKRPEDVLRIPAEDLAGSFSV
jgi:hypothetical protein